MILGCDIRVIWECKLICLYWSLYCSFVPVQSLEHADFRGSGLVCEVAKSCIGSVFSTKYTHDSRVI